MEAAATLPTVLRSSTVPVNVDGILVDRSYTKINKNPGNEYAVQIKNLCKGYDKRGPPILKNLCMSVKKGTIYGLLGSSGCGKTTALSCIVGLKKWDSGEISVFGKVPGTRESGIPGKRLGYVPQDIALHDQLSIKENLQYYGRIYGMHEFEIFERWQFLISLLQLPCEFKRVLNLSGGQKRRTSLALALVHNPELLILDEPTVGLDPLLRESVWKHLYQLVQSLGTTIIITTHYIEEARYSNTIGVMRHGRLLVEDSPTILMAQHKTDLLEDVVLKLCWKESNKRRNSKSNNNGSDDDNISDDLSVLGKSTSLNNKSNIVTSTNNAVVPIQNVVPTRRKRSSAKDSASLANNYSRDTDAIFQSKWKPDLEEILVTDSITKNGGVHSSQGKYKKLIEFDSLPPLPTSFYTNSTGIKSSAGRVHSHTPSPTQNRVKKLLSEIMDTSQRIAAFCCVVYLSLIRYPLFFTAALILPALEVLLTITGVGTEPRGLHFGVVNDDVPDWTTKCLLVDSHDSGAILNATMMSQLDAMMNTCNFNELSCKYLEYVSRENFLTLVPFSSMEDAENAVHRGDVWGYVHFPANYSQHMIDRLATKHFAFEETVNGSTISLKMDMSQYLGSVLIIKGMFDGLEQYVKRLIGACDLGARQVEIPLHFRPPVYGSLEGGYHNYIIPGVLANIMFMMPFAISAIMFITDLKVGTMGRARVAGLRTYELMLGYVITQGSVVVGQIIICTMCLKIGFSFEIVGSTLLYIAITFLLGMCGQVFGLWVGIICQDEIEALILAIFILPTMLLFGGVLWPLDAMSPACRYFGMTLPTTLITESLRSTATRGVGIAHQLMWPGIAITTGWGVFFWIVALVSFKICVE